MVCQVGEIRPAIVFEFGTDYRVNNFILSNWLLGLTNTHGTQTRHATLGTSWVHRLLLILCYSATPTTMRTPQTTAI